MVQQVTQMELLILVVAQEDMNALTLELEQTVDQVLLLLDIHALLNIVEKKNIEI